MERGAGGCGVGGRGGGWRHQPTNNQTFDNISERQTVFTNQHKFQAPALSVIPALTPASPSAIQTGHRFNPRTPTERLSRPHKNKTKRNNKQQTRQVQLSRTNNNSETGQGLRSYLVCSPLTATRSSQPVTEYLLILSVVTITVPFARFFLSC